MSNLPSFSSPAIECNLHRIPGLSRKFIYFNDDIFLGKPTYLEDFYAANRGFLIYLAWPVPPCSNSCPWMYVADGQCDKECLVPECQMDGNDCANINDKIINKEVSTEDLEGNDEDGTPSRVLADTIQKVRSNFYKSFVKKLLPSVNSTAALNITSPKASTKPNQLLRVYNMNNVKNVSKFVNDFNRMTLVNDKTRRSKFKKRKRSYFKAGNRTFYSLLKPSINVDAYSSSLQYTNRMLNGKYGFKTRKVPSHAPILIDTDIMDDLQKVFGKENDVQFSFSYYYFVMSEAKTRDVSSIFDEFDTDYSGTWSDREIRTLLTNLYELPLSYAIVDHFEALLLNCSVTGELPEVSTPPYERYIDSKLPTIAKDLVISCPSLSRILTHRFGSVPKYKYEVIHDAESKYVIFKMLNSNISDVVSNLDEIRSNRKKFVCLNDNLDDTKASENALVKAILYDFYVSLFPYPSKFELPDDLRNKFGYMRELNLWKKYRFNIKTYLYFLICLLCFAFYNLCKKKCCQIANKLFY
ncbi:hypothetical protein NQ317_009372 [Molorchus minor]|uniref:LNR domain-containing protein n=1 Tax=Molorchus minor TaxID=1323400 RepID=A0ABQ9JS16_9CUCU|nr:hypothetical protein NQ317_009372 [Molorchus minor]